MTPVSRGELLDRPVLSVDGHLVGRVKDLLIDTRAVAPTGSATTSPLTPTVAPAVAALLLEGTAESPKRAVAFGRVTGIGRDAVMIDSRNSAAGLPAGLPPPPTATDRGLIGKPVLREDGTVIGRVTDVRLDPADGRIVSLLSSAEGGSASDSASGAAAPSGFSAFLSRLGQAFSRSGGEIPVGRIRSIGTDAVVIAGAAETARPSRRASAAPASTTEPPTAPTVGEGPRGPVPA
jgi:sporulation protein YlmC with PRC-barrel domain